MTPKDKKPAESHNLVVPVDVFESVDVFAPLAVDAELDVIEPEKKWKPPGDGDESVGEACEQAFTLLGRGVDCTYL